MVAESQQLHSLTYTSIASDELLPKDVDAIHRAALTYNPLDGVTGILLFNGKAFMQMIEGSEGAIDDLVERLKTDSRHHSFEMRDRRVIDARFFPNWSMYRLDVPGSYSESLAQVEQGIANRLNPAMMGVVDQSLAAISKGADER